MKISLLIPTIRRHIKLLSYLKAELWSQVLPYNGEIEILIDENETDSIGTKRNRLLQKAAGKYTAFIDADDMIGVTYIQRMMECVNGDYDCASLKGLYSVNGVHDGVFEHTIKYDEWRTVLHGEVKYERYPNHLNLIRADIARSFKFPDKDFGEDHDWSRQIHEAAALTTEYYIPEVIYYYRKITK